MCAQKDTKYNCKTFKLISSVISEAIIAKRQGLGSRKRKLERDIEVEMGDDYILDLKKNYDLPDEYKYDVIPEFWEGHNIADYIDPEIFKVNIAYIPSTFFVNSACILWKITYLKILIKKRAYLN